MPDDNQESVQTVQVAQPQHSGSAENDRLRLDSLLAPDMVRTRDDYVTIAELTNRLEDQPQKDWTNRDIAELTAFLAEYNTLRQESMNTINSRARIMLLGLAVIGALLGGPLSIKDLKGSAPLIWLIYSLAVPIFSSLVILIWAGEAMRMKRVGDYLANDVEARINRKFGRLILSWEACLKTGALPRDVLFGPSMFVLLVFASAAFLAPLVGLQITGTEFDWIGAGAPLWQLWVPWIILALTALFLAVNRKHFFNNPVVRATLQHDGRPPSAN